jgi:hypothetical protein
MAALPARPPDGREGWRSARSAAYLRAPRCGLCSLDWRRFIAFRFGLLIMKVPLPRYVARYSFSSAKILNSRRENGN